MARKKTAARKGRLIATQSGNHHPYRNKHHISASPSVASSPSPQPQPQDLVQQRRRKGTPVRSPSQGDTSKGIVFSFRIQPGSDLSIDIRRYDQVSDEPAESQARTTSTTNSSSTSSQAEASPSIASTGATTAASASSISGSTNKSSDGREASASSLVSTQLNLAGEKWSSDPSSYLSNNVVDLTRNVLILHSRKPQDTLASSSSTTASSYPYSRSSVPSRSSSMSLPSTPPLTTDSSSSYSSASSSPSSSPSSPSSPMLEATTVAGGSCSEKELSSSFPDHLLPDPMVADLKSQVPRMLRVRGLGNASRRMQVYVV